VGQELVELEHNMIFPEPLHTMLVVVAVVYGLEILELVVLEVPEGEVPALQAQLQFQELKVMKTPVAVAVEVLMELMVVVMVVPASSSSHILHKYLKNHNDIYKGHQ
jgi:hypothetical protein